MTNRKQPVFSISIDATRREGRVWWFVGAHRGVDSEPISQSATSTHLYKHITPASLARLRRMQEELMRETSV